MVSAIGPKKKFFFPIFRDLTTQLLKFCFRQKPGIKYQPGRKRRKFKTTQKESRKDSKINLGTWSQWISLDLQRSEASLEPGERCVFLMSCHFANPRWHPDLGFWCGDRVWPQCWGKWIMGSYLIRWFRVWVHGMWVLIQSHLPERGENFNNYSHHGGQRVKRKNQRLGS